ncbi:MAG: RluA family pseudouridine synthase [Gammaproteobacteria bacterium]|jgi:23S rRNA pseudouridine955/2504/2580 synthase
MTQSAAGNRPRARLVSVSADEAGQRIDNFLARHLKGVPRSHIYRILRRGEVRVNSGRIQARYKVCAGDLVRIPPVRMAAPAVAAGSGPGARLAPQILFENERCLVINKPAGMAVHGGSGISLGVIEALRNACPEAPYLELAHRLDRETSGCLLLARRRSFLRAFHAQQLANQVRKSYLALLAGTWKGGARTVDVPLRKNRLRGGERMVCVAADGKPAVSVFTPLTRYPDATLAEVELLTGRTHQIRVHAAHIGHPLAGDEKYGNPDYNARMREYGLRRMFLHARQLSFTDPANNRPIEVTAPLDSRLQAVLDRLETS